MKRSIYIVILLLACSSCNSGRHSPAGFRLPGGDLEKGKAAFVAHRCHTCHEVEGSGLPGPTVQPPVPVVLGGLTYRPVPDGLLVTSIIYPSHRVTGYPKDQITVNGHTRMPEFGAELTVGELRDIVEFLQAHYRVRETPGYKVYY